MTPDRHEPGTSFYSGEQGTTPTPVNVEETTPEPTAEALVTPEKKRFTNRDKKIAALALAACILLGIGIDKIVSTPNNQSHLPNDNSPTPSATGEQSKPESIPEAAESFIKDYGNRYSDPLSTYYAEKSYEANVDKFGAIMTDDYINEFEILDYAKGPTDELDFSSYQLALDAKYDKETFVKIFNEYTVKELNIYMNLLAKNNSQKAVNIIDNEFRNFCSGTGNKGLPAEFKLDDAEVNTLMETVRSVVLKYGSVANYSVALGEIGSSDPSKTSFPGALTSVESFDFNGQKIISLQYSGVDLVIGVDMFNGENSTHVTEILKDLQLSITRQPITGSIDDAKSTYISIGQRGE